MPEARSRRHCLVRDRLRTWHWTIPAERSKNGKAHTLPLMPTMREIIESVPRMATRDHLFGARAPLVLYLGRRQGRTRRTLRRPGVETATISGERPQPGWPIWALAPHVIEQILNHQSGHRTGVAGVYNRSSTSARSKPRWRCGADHCAVWSMAVSVRS